MENEESVICRFESPHPTLRQGDHSPKRQTGSTEMEEMDESAKNGQKISFPTQKLHLKEVE